MLATIGLGMAVYLFQWIYSPNCQLAVLHDCESYGLLNIGNWPS